MKILATFSDFAVSRVPEEVVIGLVEIYMYKKNCYLPSSNTRNVPIVSPSVSLVT